MTRVAFIGLGNMGSGMAANQAKAGREVVAFDLSADALARAKEQGMTPAASAGEACKDADIVITMLPAGQHVRDIYLEAILPNAPKDALLIDCSTIDVDSARTVCARRLDARLPLRRRAGLRRHRGRAGRHAHLHGRLSRAGFRRDRGSAEADGEGRHPRR